jgi:hypothetical protein
MVAHERSIFVLRTHSGECRQSDLAEQIRIGLTPPRSGDDASCDDLTHCPRQAGPVARGDSSLVRLDQHFRHLRVEGMSGPSKFQDFRHSVRNDPSHKNGHRIGNACRTISSLGAVFFSALCRRTKALSVWQYWRGLVQCCSILRDAFSETRSSTIMAGVKRPQDAASLLSRLPPMLLPLRPAVAAPVAAPFMLVEGD